VEELNYDLRHGFAHIVTDWLIPSEFAASSIR
jgi:hypothetical protein